jgi:hypothetical protein
VAGRRWLALAAVALLGAAVWAFVRLDAAAYGPHYRAWQRAFSQLKPGMPETEVIGLMGPSTSRGTAFRLAQVEGFEHEYKRAVFSRSREWLFWESADFVFAVGLDDDHRVIAT